MPNLNVVMLMGNLTRDPEIKHTPKGTAIASFGIAINHTYTQQGGEKREEVTFVDLEAFGKTAEIIGEYFKKGRSIYISGRLKLDSWDDKTSGKKMSKLRVVVDSFEFLGSRDGEQKSERSEQQPASGGFKKSPPPQKQKPPVDPDLDAAEDDIPF